MASFMCITEVLEKKGQKKKKKKKWTKKPQKTQPFKRQAEYVVDGIFIFFFTFWRKCLAISCESSAKQTIRTKCQDLFSPKNGKKSKCHLLQNFLGALRVKCVPNLFLNFLKIYT